MNDKQIAKYCDDVRDTAIKQHYKIQNQRKEISMLHKKCTSQQAEIERLNGENKAFGEIIKKQDDEISVLRKDLLKREDLEKSFSKTVKQFDKKLAKTVKLERAEAVKEFAEKVKQKTLAMVFSPDVLSFEDYCECIDNLVKEMVGDTE